MSRPSPVLVYTSSRILLFVAATGVLYLLGARGLLLLLLALVVSGLLSFVLLSRQRDAVSGVVVQRSHRMRDRLDARTRAEDEADDARRAAQEAAGPEPDRPAD